MTTIKSKILWRCLLVVTACILVSSLGLYIYFTYVLQKQIIQDDTSRLKQTSVQLKYLTDDMSKFGESLIVDQSIQDALQLYSGKETMTEKVFQADELLSEINEHMSLRTDIHSYALLTTDGKVYWNKSPFDHTFEGYLEQAWYQDFILTGKASGFTSMHVLNDNLTNASQVFSFIIRIYDMNAFDHPIGQLIVNFKLEKLIPLLESGAAGFQGYELINDQGDRLFARNEANISDQQLAQLVNLDGDRRSHIAASEGYYYIDRDINDNWSLIGFTSSAESHKRILFLIIAIISFVLFSLTVIIIALRPVISNVTRPISKLNQAMNSVAAGNLEVRTTIDSGDEMERLSHIFNRMVADIKKYTTESIEALQEKQKLEIELLFSQINPHFIYNTLNTIVYLARKNRSQDVIGMTRSFISFLQETVQIGALESQTKLSHELSIVKEYANIQSYRYPNMFELNVTVEDDQLLDASIPKNIIQPLIENALFHGIFPTKSPGTISVQVYNATEERFMIEVSDNGIGMNQEALDQVLPPGTVGGNAMSRKIGLYNIRRRLQLHYNLERPIQIHSAPGQGTRITLTLYR